MMKVIEALLESILRIFYQSFWFSLLIAFLGMFFLFEIKENGFKGALRKLWNALKSTKQYRRVFLLTFFTAVILIQTLFNRTDGQGPLSNVMGDWVFYYKEGRLITRPLENIFMLIPFMLLLFLSFGDKILKKTSFPEVLGKSALISFVFSLSIETIQLIGWRGTFQISDLVYNTLGGVIGGIIYYIIYKISHRKKKD